MQSFFIPGILPTLNEIIAAAKSGYGKRNAYHRMKVSFTDYVVLCIYEAQLKPMKYVTVSFLWQEKNKRKDPDNIVAAKKFILDGLVKAGILKTDGWRHIKGFGGERWGVSDKPGVHVELYEWRGKQ